MTSPFEAFPRQPEWTRDALCAQTGPDDQTWFPHPGGSTRAAKRTCEACPVRARCLESILATESPSGRAGIWGATSAVEREVLMGSAPDSGKATRADIIARLATIGVDVEAILAEVGEVAA